MKTKAKKVVEKFKNSNKKEFKIAMPMLLLAFALVVSLIVLNGKITGFNIYNPANVVQKTIMQEFTSDTSFELNLGNNPLKGVWISGSYNGDVRIYLENNGKEYLLFASISAMPNNANEITGNAIDDEIIEEQIIQEQDSNNAINESNESLIVSNEATVENTIFDEASTSTISFIDECQETCDLNIVPKNPRIIIKLSQGSDVTINKISYQSKTNRAPQQTANIPDIELYNGEASIDLSKYFTDYDEEELTFEFMGGYDIDWRVDDGVLRIKAFDNVSNYTAFIYAKDGEKTVTSNLFNVLQPSIETTAQISSLIETPKEKVEDKVLEELDSKQSARVIVKYVTDTTANERLDELKEKIETEIASENNVEENLLKRKVVDELKDQGTVAEEVLQKESFDVKQSLSEDKIESIEIKSQDIALLKNDPNIESVVIDEPVSLLLTDVKNITKVNDAITYSPGLSGAGIRICSIDTGIDTNVVPNVITGWNVLTNDSSYFDDHGHGTQMAYVIYSIAPSSQIIAVKAINASGGGFESDILAALSYCEGQNVSIISMSIGAGSYDGYCDNNLVAQKVDELSSLGIITVAATGNDGLSMMKTPACARTAISVGASTKSDLIASFSNKHNATLLVAPGQSVVTKTLSGGSVSASGTSISASVVSGISALSFEGSSVFYSFNVTDKKNMLVHTGDLINDSSRYYSRVNLFNLMIENYTNSLNDNNVGLGENVGGEEFTVLALSVNSASILPLSPSDADNLNGYCNASFNTSDNPTGVNYKWYKNDVAILDNTIFIGTTIGKGISHSCGIRANDSRVLCWGRNDYGQLGDGTKTDRNISTLISDVSAYKSISVGWYHACGIRANDSRVLCWGYNLEGELGDGTIVSKNISTLINDSSAYSYISAGQDSTCGIRANDSRVLCWGRNNNGQIGDGTQTQRNSPTLINDSSQYNSISIGNSGICGVRKNDSMAICWAYGDGTNTLILNPSLLPNSSQFKTVSIGGVAGTYGCGIRLNDSRVLCWGWNAYGNLGRGTSEMSVRPVGVTSDNNPYSYISSGAYTACGIRANDSKVLCWGYNTNGQVGDGTTTQRNDPTLINDSSPYKLIVGGSCGIRANDSKILCWGENTYGQIGDGTKTQRNSPTIINDTSAYKLSIQSVTANSNEMLSLISNSLTSIGDNWKFSCSLTDGASNSSWINSSSVTIAMLGLNNLTASTLPLSLAGDSDNIGGYCNATFNSSTFTPTGYNFKWYENNLLNLSGQILIGNSLASGESHTCAIRANDSRVLCWGANAGGSNGDGTTTQRSSPTLINDSSAYREITAGYRHTCGIRANDSRVLCWGFNSNGQLGDGTTTQRNSPTLINDSSPYSTIASFGYHTCGIRANDSRVLCWGYNAYGQVGDGTITDRNVSKLINDSSAYRTIKVGYINTCGIRANDSRVLCWGYNTNGQVGDGTSTHRNISTLISDNSSYKTLSMGLYHTCGIRANDSRVLCWGVNSQGQLGDGTTSPRSVPGVTNDAQAYNYISCGGSSGAIISFSCGIRANDSRVLCWGDNTYVELGDGTNITRTSPNLINDTSQYKTLVSGGYHNCGIRANDSRVMCWGRNGDGQLGDGTIVNRNISTPINDTSAYKLSIQTVNSGLKDYVSSLSNSLTNLNDNWTFSCSLTDGTYNSSYVNSSSVNIINTSVAVLSVRISPTTAYMNDTLMGYCNVSSTLNVTHNYRWFKNDILNSSGVFDGTANVERNLNNKTGLNKSQSWIFSCQANNTYSSSYWMNSSAIVIGNLAPTLPTANISPSTAYTTNNLTMSCTASDSDLDNLTYNYRLFLNGNLNTSGFYLSQNTTCYQETANVSTACGGLSTGSYSSDGTWNTGTVSNFWDGSDATSVSSNLGNANLYVNYTKPQNAKSTSLWMPDYLIGNVSINQSCWNQSVLQFRIYDNGGPSTRFQAYCRGDSSWILIASREGNAYYDERMYWFMENNLTTIQSISVNVTNITSGLTVGQNWTLSCQASDGTNTTSWLNSSTVTILESATTISSRTVNQFNNSIILNTESLYGYCNGTGTNLSYYGKLYLNGALNSSASIISGLCYQEYANVSTACGGLSTGKYDSFSMDISTTTDGNWGTSYSPGAGGGTLYVNYTKPNRAKNTSIWSIRGQSYWNVTISYPSCWNQPILQLALISVSGANLYPYCWNGTSWNQLSGGSGSSGTLYEEAMYWDIEIPTSGAETNIVNFTSGLSPGQNWTLSCLASNGGGNSTWVNSTVTIAQLISETIPIPYASDSDNIAGYCNATYNATPIYYNFRWYINSTLYSSGTYNASVTSVTYDETADQYSCDAGWTNCANAFDSDYSTNSYGSCVSSIYSYANYTKPSGTINAVTWQVKDGQLANLTVPSSCYNQSLLRFRIYSYCGSPQTGWDCWDGGSWYSLRTTSGVSSYIYEEGIFWNTTNFVPSSASSGIEINANNISSSLTSATQNWTLSCQANVSNTLTSWVNSTPTIIASVPTITNASISNSTIILTTDTLLGYCAASSNVNVSYSYRLFLNGVMNSSNSTGDFSPNSVINVVNWTNTTKGQNWTISCMATNIVGDDSSWMNSSPVRVNTILTSTTSPAVPLTTTNLEGFCNSSYDGSNVSYSFKWYKNSVLNRTGISDIINCTQESANVSNDCGGLSTGTYYSENINNFNNCIDGDWISTTCSAPIGQIGRIYVNYTKPSGVLNTSTFHVKPNGASVWNVDFLPACWNQSKLILKIEMSDTLAYSPYVYCWNGGSWSMVENASSAGTGSSNSVYDESMTWLRTPSYNQNEAINLSNISNSELIPLQNWTFSCQANFSGLVSNWVNSSVATIVGTPILQSMRISPTTAYKNDTLLGYCTFVGASPINYKWKWYNGTSLYSSGNITTSVSTGTEVNVANISSVILKSQNWTISCMANNSYGNSSWYNSTITISNYWPTQPSQPTISPTAAYETTVLNSSAGSGSTDIDSDSITYFYNWTNGTDTLQFNTTSSFNCNSNSGCKKGVSIYVATVAGDGYINSSQSTTSSGVTIQNTAPTTPSSLTPLSGNYTTNVTITCSGSTDVDGDTIYYSIASNLTGSYTNLAVNDADGIYSWNITGLEVNGVDLQCNATDLTNQSSNYNPAGTIDVDSNSPRYNNVVTNTSSTRYNLTIMFNVTWTDNHLKSCIFEYYNGSIWSNTTIQNCNATQSVIKTITATRGMSINYSWYANDSLGQINHTSYSSIVVDNTAPIAPTILTPTTGPYNDTVFINCSLASDADSDSLTYNLQSNITGNWQTIVSGDADGYFAWDVRGYEINGVDLQCNASDGINTTSYYNTAGVLNIDSIAPRYSNIVVNNSAPIFAETVMFNASFTDNYLQSCIFEYYDGSTWSNTTVTNCNATQSVVKTITGIKDMVVNYSWYANDTSGKWNHTTYSSFVIVSTPPTTPTNLTPTNGLYKDIVYLNCSGSTDVDNDTIFYSMQSNITGSWQNIITNDADGYYEWNVQGYEVNGVDLRCNATDGARFSSYYNPTEEINVDSIAPRYSNIVTNSSSVRYGLSLMFNVTWTENYLADCIFEYYDGSTWSNTTITNCNATQSVIKTITATRGMSINYSWYANDSMGQMNHTTYTTITVDNTAPIAPTILTPTTGLYNTTVFINCTNATDIDGDVLTYSLQSNITGNWQTIVSGDADGYFAWDVRGYEINGVDLQCNASDGINTTSYYNTAGEINVDSIAPEYSNIQTNSSAPKWGEAVNFSVSFTDNYLGGCVFEYYNGSSWSNTTFPSCSSEQSIVKTTTATRAMIINYSWYVFDSQGQMNHTYYSALTVDNTPPSSPTILTPTTGLYKSPIEINCTVANDVDNDVLTYSIQSNITGSFSDIVINDSDGYYSWSPGNYEVYGVDLRCNTSDGGNYSSYYNPAGTIDVDTIAPRYSSIESNNSAPKYGEAVNFTITFNDTHLQSCIFEYYNGSTWSNTTIQNCNATQSITKTITATRGMLINYSWYANDTLAQTNHTEYSTLTIDNTPPTAPNSLTPTEGTYANNVTIACSGSSDVDNDAITYTIRSNVSGSMSILSTNNSNGTYNWNIAGYEVYGVNIECYANDSRNSSSAFNPSGIINLDTIPPRYSSIAVNNSNPIYGEDVNFTIFVSDPHLQSCIFEYYNGSDWSNTTLDNCNSVTESVVKTISGKRTMLINYSWYVNDTLGNINQTEYNSFNVINTLPITLTPKILPTTPNTSDTLIGYCNSSDVDNDLVGYNWTWYYNGELNISGTTNQIFNSGEMVNIANISADNVFGGSNWIFSCKAFDTGIGNMINSSSMLVTDWSCMNITQSGKTIILTSDTYATESCFIINATNVTINGNGKIIHGNNITDTYAVLSPWYPVTVTNLGYDSFTAGVERETTTGSFIVENVTLQGLQTGYEYSFLYNVTLNNTANASMNYISIVNTSQSPYIVSIVNLSTNCNKVLQGQSCYVMYNVTASTGVSLLAPGSKVVGATLSGNWINNNGTPSQVYTKTFYMTTLANPQMSLSQYSIILSDNLSSSSITTITVANNGNVPLGENANSPNDVTVSYIEETAPSSWIKFQSTNSRWQVNCGADCWDYITNPNTADLKINITVTNYTSGIYTGKVNITALSGGLLQSTKIINLTIAINPNYTLSIYAINKTENITSQSDYEIAINSTGNSPITNVTVAYVEETLPEAWVTFNSVSYLWNNTLSSFTRIVEYTGVALNISIRTIDFTPGIYTGLFNITTNEGLSREVDISVTVNPQIEITQTVIGTIVHGEKGVYYFDINSTGNAKVINITAAFAQTSLPSEWIIMSYSANENSGNLVSVGNLTESQNARLQFNVTIPRFQTPGDYTGIINITTNNIGNRVINVTITVPVDSSWNIIPPINKTKVFTLNTGGVIGEIAVNNTGNIPLNFSIGYNTNYNAGGDICADFICLSNNNPTSIFVNKNSTSRINISAISWSETKQNVGVEINLSNSTANPTYSIVVMVFNVTNVPPSLINLSTIGENYTEMYRAMSLYGVVSDDEIVTGSTGLNLSSVQFIVNYPNGTIYTISNDSIYSWNDFDHLIGIEAARWKFRTNFTQTNAQGWYNFSIYIKDKSGNEISNNISRFEILSSTNISVLSITNGTISNVTMLHGDSSLVQFSINNTGRINAYNATLSLSNPPSGISISSETVSELGSRQNITSTASLIASAVTSPGNYTLYPVLIWQGTDSISSNVTYNAINLEILSNPEVTVDSNVIVNINHGNTSINSIYVNSTGNVDYRNAKLTFVNNSMPNSWFSFYSNSQSYIRTLGLLAKNSTTAINLYLNVSIGTPPGNYSGTINVTSTDYTNSRYKTINFTISVPLDGNSWSATSNYSDDLFSLNEQGTAKTININNNGNANLTFTLTYSPYGLSNYSNYNGLFNVSGQIGSNYVNPTNITIAPATSSSIIIYQNGWNASINELGINITIDSGFTTQHIPVMFNITDAPPQISRIIFQPNNYTEFNTPITIIAQSLDDSGINLTSYEVNITLPNSTISTLYFTGAGENSTLNGKYVSVNFSNSFTQTTVEGNYTVIAYVKDVANQIGYSQAYNFTVIGKTSLNATYSNRTVAVSNVSLYNGEAVSFTLNLTNRGLVNAYDINLSFAGNASSWVLTSLNYPQLIPSQINSSPINLAIPANTSPGNYILTPVVTWRDANGMTNSTLLSNVTIAVSSNKYVRFRTVPSNYTITHGTTNLTQIIVDSLGNDYASNVMMLLLDVPANFTVDVTPVVISSIAQGQSRTVNLSILPAFGIANGTYSFSLKARNDNLPYYSDVHNAIVAVPASFNWNSTHDTSSRNLTINGVSLQGSENNDIIITSLANSPMYFSFILSGQIVDMGIVGLIETTKTLQPLESYQIRINHTSPYANANYTGILTIDSGYPPLKDIGIDYIAHVATLSITNITPNASVVAGRVVNITTRFVFENSNVTTNMTYGVKINQTTCEINTTTTVGGEVVISCIAPSLTDATYYPIRVDINYSSNVGIVSAYAIDGTGVFYLDVTPPSVNETSISRGLLGNNITISANVTDNYRMGEIEAIIVLNNGTEIRKTMTNTSSQLPYVYTVAINASETFGGNGVYYAVISANDTTGNVNNDSIVTIEVYSQIQLEGTLKDLNNNPILSNFIFDSPIGIENFSTNSSGYYNYTLISRVYNLTLNFSIFTVRIYEVPFYSRNSSFILLDRITPADVGGQLVNPLSGFAVNSDIAQNALMTINFAGINGISSKDNLRIYQCSNWNYDQRICNANWIQLTSHRIDKINNVVNATSRVFSNTTSAFMLSEISGTETSNINLPTSSFNLTINHSQSRKISVEVQSIGTTNLDNVYATCTSGTLCSGFNITSDSLASISSGSLDYLNITIEVPLGYSPGNYLGTFTVSAGSSTKTFSVRVTVPQSLTYNYTLLPNITQAGSGKTGWFGFLNITNTGNDVLNLNLTSTSTAIILASGNMTVQKQTTNFMNLTYVAPQSANTYYHQIIINNGTASQRDINVTLNVTHEITITSVTPSSEIIAGDSLEIRANLLKWQTYIFDGVTWSVKVNGTNCPITNSSYSGISGYWSIFCNAPNVTTASGHGLILTALYNGVEAIYPFNVEYKDLFPPIIINYTTSMLYNASAVSIINATLFDDNLIRNITLEIITPSGTTINVPVNLSNYTVTTSRLLNETGDYLLIYNITDSQNNSRTINKTYEIYTVTNFNGEIISDNGTAVEDVTFKLYPREGESYSHMFTTSSEGNYNQTINNRTYKYVEIDAFNASIRYENLRIGDYPNKFQIDTVDFTKFSVDNTNSRVMGIAVNTTINKSALVTFTYNPEDINNPADLRIYKCSLWNHTERKCALDYWTLIPSTRNNNNLIQFNVSSFSAYILVEAARPAYVVGDGICSSASGETNSNSPDDCEASSATTVIVSGGGGGGGGSSSTTTTTIINENNNTLNETRLKDILKEFIGEEKDLQVDTTKISREMYPGEMAKSSIVVKNKLNKTVSAKISLSGTITDFVSMQNPFHEIAGGQSLKQTLQFAIPAETKAGIYTGELIIVSDDDKEISKVPIEIRVLEIKDRLLDLKVSPLNERVVPGDTLRMQVDIFNLGMTKRVDLQLKMKLVNPETLEVLSESEESIAVETTLSVIKPLKVPDKVPLGRYIVQAEGTYSNEQRSLVARSLTTVTVAMPWYEYKVAGFAPIWILIMLVVFFAINILLFEWYEKRRASRRKYQVPVDYHTLPVPGPRTLFVGNVAESSIRTFIDAEKLQTHTIVAGSTGSGKSFAAQVIAEEALKNNIAVIVYDPTVQWSGFLRKCTEKRILKGYKDFSMNLRESTAFNGNVRTIRNPREKINLQNLMQPGEITVFDISKLDPSEMDVFVASTIKQVFDARLEESPQLKLLIVYDEVHRLLPKFGGSGEGFVQLERGVREFRKWGVGMMLISQVLSDFVGQIKSNINLEVQLKTKDEEDLNRIKIKYGDELLKTIVKSNVGTGLVQNSEYNKGRPYFISFRPLLHSVTRLSDEELKKYEEYNTKIDDLSYQISRLAKYGIDIFDINLELKLAIDKLKEGAFSMVEIYLDGVAPRIEQAWRSIGKAQEHYVRELIAEKELKKEIMLAKKERDKSESSAEKAFDERYLSKPLPARKIYVIKEKRNETGLELFEKNVFFGAKGMCISRINPELLKQKPGFRSDEIYWLSTQNGRNVIEPHMIEEMYNTITSFINKNEGKEGVIFIDGINIVIANTSFERVLNLLTHLKDIAATKNIRLIIPINTDVLKKSERAHIDAEFEVIERLDNASEYESEEDEESEDNEPDSKEINNEKTEKSASVQKPQSNQAVNSKVDAIFASAAIESDVRKKAQAYKYLNDAYSKMNNSEKVVYYPKLTELYKSIMSEMALATKKSQAQDETVKSQQATSKTYGRNFGRKKQIRK